MIVIVFDYVGQQCVCDGDEVCVVCVDYCLLFVEVGFVGWFDVECEVGVVDQYVECCEFGGKGGWYGFDGCVVVYVEFEWQKSVVKFGGECIEMIFVVCGCDDVMVFFDEGLGDGGVEVGGCVCDEYDYCCFWLVM